MFNPEELRGCSGEHCQFASQCQRFLEKGRGEQFVVPPVRGRFCVHFVDSKIYVDRMNSNGVQLGHDQL